MAVPAVLARHWKKAEKKQALVDAYTLVDARDQGYSVISGVYTDPGSPDPKRRREHHHLRGRNAAPELVNSQDHILTVSAFEHQLLHAKALLVEGESMRERLIFSWNREIVPAGKEPFRLKSKRWSQNEDE